MKALWLAAVGSLAACGKDPDPRPGTGGAGSATRVAVAVDAAITDAPAMPAPDATPAPPDAMPASPAATSRVIGASGVGPITRSTKGSVAALAAILPGHWEREVNNDAEGNEVILLRREGLEVRVDDAGEIFEVDVADREFATAAGIRARDTVAALRRAYHDLTCTLEVTEVDELVCESPGLAHVAFDIELPRSHLREGKVATKKIARQKIDTIAWRR